MTSPGDRPILSHSRRQVTALAAIAFGNFWLAACLSLQAPFFPKEAQIKGASETQHGLIMGTYELFIGLGSPVFGKLLSCVQAKYLALFGLLLAGVSTILFGLLDLVPAGGTFVTLAFVLRTLEGIGAASFETSTYTLMASEFPERVASIFAILETSYGLGLILGPTIGGALYQAGGYTLPFVAAGSLILCVGIIIIICVNSSATKVSRSAAMLDFFRDGTILVNALSIATATNMVGFNSATLEPHLRQFNLTPLAIGFVFVLIGAVYAATGPVFGKLCDKGYDPKAICIMGCVLCIAGAILVGPLPWIDHQPTIPSIVAAMVLIGLGFSAKTVAAFSSSSDHAIRVKGLPDDVTTYGMVTSMFLLSYAIGATVGPSAGGYFLEQYGYRNATVYLLAVEVWTLFIFAVTKVFAKKTTQRVATLHSVTEQSRTEYGTAVLSSTS